MQKALVVGSTGFFGRHFVKKASKLFEIYEANTKKYNLLTDEIFCLSGVKFDYIFYFAVKTAAGGYCQKHPGEQFLINQKLNSTILNYWKEVQPHAKFITFGSSCSYSDNVVRIEDNYLDGQCETGYEVYGMTKRMLLIGLRAMAQEYGMKYIYYVPSVFYGEDYDIEDKHFIYDLIRKICNAKYGKSDAPVLWGNGRQRRELIYIADAVDILLNNLHRKNEVINLSPGYDYSIKEYASLISKIIDYDFNLIQFDITGYVGAFQKKFINNKLKEVKFTDLEIGLKKTIEYYIDNYLE